METTDYQKWQIVIKEVGGHRSRRNPRLLCVPLKSVCKLKRGCKLRIMYADMDWKLEGQP